MNKKHFSIGEVLSESKDVFKKNWWFLVKVMLVTGLINLPFGILNNLWTSSWQDAKYGLTFWPSGMEIFSYVVFFIIYSLVSGYLTYGLFKIYLNVVDGKHAKVGDLFKTDIADFFYYVLGYIAYVILVILGFIALIIPGIYLSLKYMFIPIIMIDKKLKVMDAAKLSGELTEGVKWKFIGLSITLMCLFILAVIVGLICLIVGVIPAIISMVIIAYLSNIILYRKLLAQNHNNNSI